MHDGARRLCLLEPEFKKRGVKLIGLSANTVSSHKRWLGVDHGRDGQQRRLSPSSPTSSAEFAYLSTSMLGYQDTDQR